MKLLFSLLFSLCLLSAGFGQFNMQHTTNFTSRDYGRQYSAYTHAIVCDAAGYIYAGTASGILQYDGYSWRCIPARMGVFVTSLALINDTVFVGCQGDFGYLAIDERGKYGYVSIAESSLDIDVPFTTVWKILETEQGIAFQSEECIFLYRAGKIRQVMPETSFHLAFSVNKRLFIRERNIGLCEFISDSLELVRNGELFADTGVFSILLFGDNKRLVVTQEAGVFEWGNEGFIQILTPDMKDRFNAVMVVGATVLSDGNIAFYSLKDGIFITDPDVRNIVAHYSEGAGMKSPGIHDIEIDRYGSIWGATKTGICRIQYGSPYSVFSEASGVSGSVQAISFFNGNCYIGTSGGLYVSTGNETVRFAEEKSIVGSIWATVATDDALFAGGDNGLWMTGRNGTVRALSKEAFSGLTFVSQEQWIIAAGSSGVRFFDATTGRMLKDIPEAASDAHGIAYTKTGTGEYEIWIGSKTQGVIYISTGKTLDYIIDFYQGAPDGLPNDWVCAYQAGEAIWFGTSTGILRFISPAEIAEMAGTPEDASIRGFFDYAGVPSNMSNVSATACSYGDKFSYIALDAGVYKIDMNDLTGSGNDFRNIELGRFNTIFDNDSCLFIGGDDGLAVFDKQKAEHRSGLLPVFGIREIIVGKDSVIWFGDKAFANNELTLPYNMNSITVKLYSLFSDNGFRLQYSWRMEGENDEFSEWNYNHILTFERLREGTYTLQIKAKDSDMDNIAPAELHFRVLPPWYRTWWAYICYFIFAAGLIYLLVYLNSRRLVAKNKKLEEIIRIRTQEVVEQKEEIQEQKETIETILDDLNDSISYAKQIQEAILPPEEVLKENFDDSFILFKPRNVVSGDFYWATRVKEWLVFTVADCTGHGVPGAFMSMLGISFLNEIVRNKEITRAGEILDHLRNSVIEALKQKDSLIAMDMRPDHKIAVKDGMDIVLCVYNTETGMLQFSGANNPLFIVKNNGELVEIKPDKQPVAIHIEMHPFTNNEVSLEKGDRLYLITDGYQDQFGGEKNKKYKIVNLKQKFTENYRLPMNEQLDSLHNTFESWKGDLEQIDDVTIMGVRI